MSPLVTEEKEVKIMKARTVHKTLKGAGDGLEPTLFDILMLPFT